MHFFRHQVDSFNFVSAIMFFILRKEYSFPAFMICEQPIAYYLYFLITRTSINVK